MAAQVRDKQFIIHNGACPIHHSLPAERVRAQKVRYPEAKLLAHPECNPDVLALSDFIGSTAAILQYVQNSTDTEFLIATEVGIVDRMQYLFPEKTIRLLQNCKRVPEGGVASEKQKKEDRAKRLPEIYWKCQH